MIKKSKDKKYMEEKKCHSSIIFYLLLGADIFWKSALFFKRLCGTHAMHCVITPT